MAWESHPTAGGWTFTNPEHNAHIILDYIMPTGRGLEAWVELRVDGDEIPVSSGQRNLMTAGASRPFLDDTKGSKVPWSEGLRLAFYETVAAWREGASTVDLSVIEPEDLTFLLDPLVEQGGNTRLIAPGGSGKSLLAMAIAMSVATGSRKFLGLEPQLEGPVLYLDWETNASTHARRIRALCDPIGVPYPGRDRIFYRSEGMPLYRSMQAVRRAADRAEAVMLVVDSAKMAAGASGQSSGEDSTLNLFTALREIGRPAVIVDHKSKEDVKKGRRGGYGSVFNTNLARLEWEFTRYREVSRTERHFVLSLEKQNNVGALPPVGFKMVTEGGRTGITRATFQKLSASAIIEGVEDDLADRILSLFETSYEPMDIGRMVEILDVNQNTLRRRLNSDPRFVNVNKAKGGRGLWRPAEEFLPGPTDDGAQDELGPVSDWRDGVDVF